MKAIKMILVGSVGALCAVSGMTIAPAVEYNDTVLLTNTELQAGDIVKVVDKSRGIDSGRTPLYPLALGNGAFELDMTLGDQLTTFMNAGINLVDGGSHDLGIGSLLKITNNSKKRVSALYATDNTSVKASELFIHLDSGSSSGEIIGIDLSGATMNLGDKSSLELSGGNINQWHTVVDLFRSTLDANNFTVTVKTPGQVELLSVGTDSAANLKKGSNIDIEASAGAVVYLAEGAKFTAENDLKIKAKYTQVRGGENYLININGSNRHVDLGESATLIMDNTGTDTWSHNAIWIVPFSSNNSLTAKNLRIDAIGAGSALALSGGTTTIDGLTLKVDHGMGINSLESGTEVHLSDADITTYHGTGFGAVSANNGALVSVNNLKVSASGAAHAVIARFNGSQINLSGDITLNSANGHAMYADSTARTTVNGKLVVNKGAIFAASGGNINLNLQAGSDISGNIYARDGGVVEMKTEGTVIRGNVTELTNNTSGRIRWEGTNTRWEFNDDPFDISGLTSLNLRNSQIDFSATDTYNTLMLGALDGSVEFIFKTDIPSNALTDKLEIAESAQGTHTVKVINRADIETTGEERINIIDATKTTTNGATFTGTNEIELGGYLFALRPRDEDVSNLLWDIVSTGLAPELPEEVDPPITTTAQASVNTLTTNYLINLAEMRALSDRLGLIHEVGAQGIWARTYGGKFSPKHSDKLEGFDFKYFGLQMGYDQTIYRTESGEVVVGAEVGYLSGDSDYRTGDGKNKSYSAALYMSYFDADFYIDTYLKYAHLRNSFTVKDSAGMDVHGKSNNNLFTFSIEGGKRFYLNQTVNNRGLYLAPRAQLAISKVGRGTFMNSNGLKVNTDSLTSTLGRAGFVVGYDYQRDTRTHWNFYGSIDYVKEFSASTDFTLNKSLERYNFKGDWFEFGVGVTGMMDTNHQVFADIKLSNGDKFKEKYRYNVGYRYHF